LAVAGLDDRVRVIADSAEHVLASMARQGQEKLSFVISGIPLGNLDRNCVSALLDSVRRVLRRGGMYIQFQYSLMDRRNIKAQFPRLRTVPVFLNFPPAVVYYAYR